VDQELWRLDATDQIAALQARQVTSVELVTAHLARIDQVNPVANAVVRRLDAEALEAAEAADEALAAGLATGPLHGVPITVKTNLDVAGQVTDESSAAFVDNDAADEDSPPVRHLRAAGAIFHGRTNMPDFGMRWNTDNPLYGQTHNPWDRTKTPGGSSGGDGVAVATGMAPIGLGNDFGGSIRLPAAYNGVVGLRPTPGRIPYDVDGPEDRGASIMFFYTDGPIARSVRDVKLTFDVLRQGDPRDPFWANEPLGESGPCEVVLLRDALGVEHHPEVLEGLARAAAALEDAGYTVREGSMPSLLEAADLWRDITATDIHSVVTDEFIQMFSDEARRWLRATIDTGILFDQREYIMAGARRAWIAAEWSKRMAVAPLVLGAADTGLAWDIAYDTTGDIDDAIRTLRGRYALNLAGSLLGLATVVLPVGVGASGLPQSVQLAGWRYQEERALTAAAEIESRLGRFTPVDPR
jgi:amidase